MKLFFLVKIGGKIKTTLYILIANDRPKTNDLCNVVIDFETRRIRHDILQANIDISIEGSVTFKIFTPGILENLVTVVSMAMCSPILLRPNYRITYS